MPAGIGGPAFPPGAIFALQFPIVGDGNRPAIGGNGGEEHAEERVARTYIGVKPTPPKVTVRATRACVLGIGPCILAMEDRG